MNRAKDKQQTESFTKRWSRNKGVAEGGERTKNKEQEAPIVRTSENVPKDITSSTQEKALTEKEEKRAILNALSDEDMPPIDSLDENSDFAQFMSTNVSEPLRKLALRKLFHGKTYHIRDGLDEYDGDYTHFEKLDPSTITADMRHMIEVEAEKQKELEAQLDADQVLASESTELAGNKDQLIEGDEQTVLDSHEPEEIADANAEPLPTLDEQKPLPEDTEKTDGEKS